MAQSPYRIKIQRSARKSLERLSADIRYRIEEAIASLAWDPRPPGAKRLQGGNEYRIRIGAYRVIYTIRDDELLVLIIDVGHRKDVYRSL